MSLIVELLRIPPRLLRAGEGMDPDPPHLIAERVDLVAPNTSDVPDRKSQDVEGVERSL